MSEQTKEIAEGGSLQKMLTSGDIRKRFEDMLGKKTPGFISSILAIANSNQDLRACDPKTVISAAAMAAALDLPINPNLSFAYIVPYSGRAQFQMGWKGFVQLGIRTGQYKTMNASEVYADELKSWNPITGDIEFTPQDTWKQRYTGTGKVIGYVSYFRLVAGYEKYFYMTVEEVRAHGKKFSKSFANPKSQWQQNFTGMALKTVMKLNLNKWGVLSIEMEKASKADQGVIIDADAEEVEYPDRPEDSEIPSKPSGADRQINDAEFRLLCARADKAGINEADVKAYIKERFSKGHRHELNVTELTIVLDWIKSASEPPAASNA